MMKKHRSLKQALEDAPYGRDALEELTMKRTEAYWAKWCELRARKRGVSVSDLSDDEDAIAHDIDWRAAEDIWFIKPQKQFSPVVTPCTWLTTPASEREEGRSAHESFLETYRENREEMRQAKLMRARQRREAKAEAKVPRGGTRDRKSVV